jgi:urease accessory protein
MKKQLICGISLLACSTMGFAHPDHGLTNAYAGFMHPFMGLDHLLMMLAIGVWAAKLSGSLRWQLPVTFLGFMVVGASLGSIGFNIFGIETAIAASVIAMGGLLAINLPISAIGRISIVAVFAMLHGVAHGVELQNAVSQSDGVLFGMLLATALLHGLGFVVGLQHKLTMKWLNSGLAFLMFAVGGFLLLS